MDVKIIRFLNGEEVIGKITKEDAVYTIENGAIIVPVGEQQLGMVPWLPHCEDKSVSVSEEKVAFVFTPLTDLANQYSTNFGSGIVIPKAASMSEAPNLKFSGSD